MRRVKRNWIALVFLAGACAGSFGQAVPKDTAQTVAGFRVPDYDENNQLKSMLFGDFARVLPDGIIEITNLKIDFFTEGRVHMTVTSPRCIYNQKDNTARSDAEVRIERDNLLITGTGFWWGAKQERFEIFRQSRVELKNLAQQVTTGESP